MQDFHPGETVMKSVICKKYNNGTCNKKPNECEYLHICIKCKHPHQYVNCKYIVMYCPLCKVTMNSAENYVMHQVDPIHLSRISTVKKIVEPLQNSLPPGEGQPGYKKHVLVI